MNPTGLHRRVVSLAVPAALKQLLDIIQLLIDMVMVGTLGVAALAAVGLSMQFMMVIQAFMTLFAVGASTLIAQYIGSRRLNRASSVVYVAIIMALCMSFVVMGIGYFGADDFYGLMSNDAEVIRLGSDFFSVLSLGMSLIFLDTLAFSALSAAGDTKSSLYIKIISAMINIGLNYLFIFGHGSFEAMGVVGAAYGTLCAYAFSLLAYGWLFYRGKRLGIITVVNRKDLRNILRIGLPSVAERLIGISGFLVFIWLIARYSTEALAGYQVGLRIEAFAFMPGVGFSVAAMALVGQYIGAKNYEDAYRAGILSAKIAIVFMGSVGIVLMAFPHFLAGVFTNDATTIEQAVLYLRCVGAVQIPLALTFVLSGALRGAGATRLTLRISAMSLWFFRIVPASILVYLGVGIMGVYGAMTIETVIKGFWFWKEYKSRVWMKKIL